MGQITRIDTRSTQSGGGLLGVTSMGLQEGVRAYTPAGRHGGGSSAIGTSDVIGSAPWSDHDPYTDEALLDPWPGYQHLRNGVMMNDRMNQVLRGNTLCSDGPDHHALRDVLRRPLTPRALRAVREEITAEAEGVVRKLVAQGSFDAATELANHLPASVVSNLVGLPEKGRERMLVWAEEMFNCFGPMNDKTIASFEVLDEMMDYATNEAVPDKLKPGSWARGHPRRGGARGGARAGVPGDDGRLHGPQPGHHYLRHQQRRVVVREQPRPVGPGAHRPAADAQRDQRSVASRRAYPRLLALCCARR
jgi:hypothetical protein